MLALMKRRVAISGLVAPAGGEASDLRLLRREVVAGLVDAFAGTRTGREQLDSGPVGEAVGAHRLEGVACRLELFAGVAAPLLSPEPLAVDQLGARELQPRAACLQLGDRLVVVGLGVGVARQQRFGREPGARDRARSDWRRPVQRGTPARPARPRCCRCERGPRRRRRREGLRARRPGSRRPRPATTRPGSSRGPAPGASPRTRST